ncbi:trihelix protein [Artemisia annua]|uniref:Trihelix protein n=1 Tax=Artemisia annua TaxID=35608 RepID=A0A2U1PP36_ARTAN|nr:trihelix protein [Artemisia annua]
MDGEREDSKYAVNYGTNQGYGSMQVPKELVRNVPYTQSQMVTKYEDDDEVEDEEEEQEPEEERNVGDNEVNGSAHQIGVDDDDEDDDDGNNGINNSVNMQRHPKKRKLKSLLLSYELAPRVPPVTPAPTSGRKYSYGGRNTLTDWTEHETFVLLEAWGDRFLQCGRKSLRSEEWQEVADRVSQVSKMERSDSQCRNRLDTLKKKYKKEKANINGSRGVNSKWVYFKKMDMLLSSSIQQAGSVSRGVDSRENVFRNPSVPLSITNGVDESRDSAGNSESQEGDDDSDLLPPKKLKSVSDRNSGSSFKLLADSINKFSKIYERIENSKIQQMIELEKMRMDFQRDLEMQKRQILDRAQSEISKVRQGNYDDNDVSAENVSG